MTHNNQILVFVFSFLIAGLFVLSQPEKTFSGVMIGCCRGSDGNCIGAPPNPTCGPPGSTCQAANAGGCTEEFQEGQVCFQVTSNTGECRETPPESQTGCCEFQDGDFRACQEPVTFSFCEQAGAPSVWTSAGLCDPEGACVIPPPPPQIPTLNQWGTTIMAGVLGLFAVIGIFAMRRRTVAS